MWCLFVGNAAAAGTGNGRRGRVVVRMVGLGSRPSCRCHAITTVGSSKSTPTLLRLARIAMASNDRNTRFLSISIARESIPTIHSSQHTQSAT
jgi:hypothetical protein